MPEDPSQFLAAALDADEVTDTELEAVDDALNGMLLNEGLAASQDLMPLEEAQAKLSPEVLKVLAEKFKGSLTQVRHLDERDQIF